MTGEGEALYRRIVPRVLAWERDLLDGLSPGEYRDLMYILDKLGKRLGAGA